MCYYIQPTANRNVIFYDSGRPVFAKFIHLRDAKRYADKITDRENPVTGVIRDKDDKLVYMSNFFNKSKRQ